MVDPGELVSLTLQREFSEEALNSLAASPQDRERIHERITQLFNSPGLEVSRLERIYRPHIYFHFGFVCIVDIKHLFSFSLSVFPHLLLRFIRAM